MSKITIFRIDKRSLGLFRILLGFALLGDTIHKLLWVNEFYTDWGLLPRSYWLDTFSNPNILCFHLAMGTAWFQISLFLFQILFFSLYTLGLKPGLFGFLGFLLLTSMQARNHQILNCADTLLRLALFWSLFLPLTSRFSGTKAKPGSNAVIEKYFDLFVVPFRMQLILVYSFTALYKLHPVWTREFSAVYYALHIDLFAASLAKSIRDHQFLTQTLTATTIVLESYGPLASFLPGYFRLAVISLFASFHFGTFLTMELGLFPWICIIYWTAFLPSQFWEFQLSAILEQKLDLIFLWIQERNYFSAFEANVEIENPKTRHFPPKLTLPLFALLCFALVIWENFGPFLPENRRQPSQVKAVTDFLNLSQTWNMFSPYPMRNDGWFVIEGTFQDQSKTDLLTLLPKSYAKPQISSALYPNSEWRKYMINIWVNGNRNFLLPYGRFLCRKFSISNGWPSNLSKITVEFMKESTPPPGEMFPQPELVNLWDHDCFARD